MLCFASEGNGAQANRSERVQLDALPVKVAPDLGELTPFARSTSLAKLFTDGWRPGYANAKDVFEDGRLAAKWLCSENALLQGDRPIETIDTQPGFDRVRDLLMRIEHGVTV